MLLAGPSITACSVPNPADSLERVAGTASLGVMGIETLNTAAWAAGFAMAANDEPLNEPKAEARPEADTAWRASNPVLDVQRTRLVSRSTPSTTEWVKGVFGAFGRRAPA
jgi:hypothetical protein